MASANGFDDGSAPPPAAEEPSPPSPTKESFPPTVEEPVVVVAVDASAQSLNAFNYYVRKLHRDSNRVIILFCPELSSVALRFLKAEKTSHTDWDQVMAEERKPWQNLKEKYEALIKQNMLRNAVFAVSESQYSKPGEGIVHYAEQVKSVMVVMGTRGLGAIRRTIMGSVSDYVVHHAHCPVVVCGQHK